MTEAQILEILTRNVDGTSNTSLLFPKLSPDCVRSISRNIAHILYNSLTTKSASNENNRLDILLLLQKWCGNNGNHLKINRNNYDCFIHALNHCTLPNDDLETRIELDDFDETCKLDFTAFLTQHYKNMEIINKEKSKCVEIIKNRDRKKCGDNVIFVPNNPKHVASYDTFLLIKQLMDLKGCGEITLAREVNDEVLKYNEPLTRQNQIRLAQSLLNLNKSNCDMVLLSQILEKLSGYESLQPYEANFIEYLWQKCLTEDLLMSKISLQLLEGFSFIYEKIFIKMCTDALRTSCISSVPVRSEEVQKILQLSSKSKRLNHNITNLFYELYAYSGFNNKLCDFFEFN